MIQLSVYFHKFKKWAHEVPCTSFVSSALRNRLDRDSVIIKLLVLTCAALNLTMTCLNTYTAYNYAVLDFGE